MVTTADNLIRPQKYDFENETTCGWTAGGTTRLVSSPNRAIGGMDSILEIIGDFESGIGEWGGPVSNVTWAEDTTVAHTGSRSLKVTRINSPGGFEIRSGWDNSPKAVSNIVVGDRHTTSAWVRHNCANAIEMWTTHSYYNYNTPVSFTNAPPTIVQPNTWTLITYSTIAPAAVDGLVVTYSGYLGSGPPQIGDSMWVDDVFATHAVEPDTSQRSLKIIRTGTTGTSRAQFVNPAFIESPLPSLNAGIVPELGKPYTVMARSYCDHLTASSPLVDGFEDGTVGKWRIQSGQAHEVVTSTAQAHSGLWSLRVTSPATNPLAVWSHTATNAIPVTVGETVTASLWVWPKPSGSGSQDGWIRLQWLNSSGVEVSVTSGSLQSWPVGTDGPWQLLTVTADAPAGASMVRYGWVASGNGLTNERIYIDDGLLEFPDRTAHEVRFIVNFHDAAGDSISSHTLTQADHTALGSGEWRLHYYNFYVPADANVVFMTFSSDYMNQTTADVVHYLEKPQLYAGIWTEEPSDPVAPIPFSKAPIPVTAPMSLSSHTFIVSNLLSGQVVSDVDISSFHVTETLNRPGAGQATARIDAETTTEENFLAWGNALWCLEGDEILWGGIIGAVQPRASSRVLNVPLHGFMEYYRTQPIQTTVGSSGLVTGPPNSQWEYGYGYNSHPHNSAVIFDNVDQFLIFEDLIYHVAKRDALSDIHPLVRYDQLSGHQIDYIFWYNYEYKMVGTACEQIADRDTGFFWSTRYGWDADSPTFTFYLNHNLAGTDRPIILEWDDSPEHTILTEYDFGGYEKPASSVIALGEGIGGAQKFARAESTTSAQMGQRPRYYAVRNHSDVKKQSTLNAHAQKYWKRHRIPYRSASVKMLNPEAYYLGFELGDTVHLRIDDNELHVFERYRAVSKQTVLTPQGDKDITLELEAPFVVFE